MKQLSLAFNLSSVIYIKYLDGHDSPYKVIESNYEEILDINPRSISNIISKMRKLEFDSLINNVKDKYNGFLEHIFKNTISGNLTLVLGAGVSIDSGIPTWDELIKFITYEIYEKIGKSYNKRINTTKIMEMLKEHNFNNLRVAKLMKDYHRKYNSYRGIPFYNLVRDVLYRNYKENGECVSAIVDFLSKTDNTNTPIVSNVINFNFDSILQVELDRRTIPFKTIYDNNCQIDRNVVNIHHPHGYLPKNINDSGNHFLIFSEEQYHYQFDNTQNSNYHQFIDSLQSKTCLFIGTSLADPNQRKLLDISRKKSKYLKKTTEEIQYDKGNGGFYYQTRPKHYIIKKKLSTNEVLKSTDSDTLFALQEIDYLESLDNVSIGLNTVWIEDYSEIANILNYLSDMTRRYYKYCV